MSSLLGLLRTGDIRNFLFLAISSYLAGEIEYGLSLKHYPFG